MIMRISTTTATQIIITIGGSGSGVPDGDRDGVLLVCVNDTNGKIA
jgi:hypothetical protein